MTTNAALERVEMLQGVSPTDAATIIRTLGSLLVDAYAAVPQGAANDEPQEHSGWGSKQREQLLRALVGRVAGHALTFQNAALRASDAAIAEFARKEFKSGGTRSPRDRAPITKNVDKVVGGWLRRLGRKMRQDAVTTSMTGAVMLRERTARFRLLLTFAYPRRVIADRQLVVTARFEELLSDGVIRPVPFDSDPDAASVVLPENRRQYRPAEARAVRDMLASLKSLAEMLDDPELIDYADRGLNAFVRLSRAKVAVAVFASVIAFSAIAGAVEWVHRHINAYRLLPTITHQCEPRALLLHFPSAPAGGVQVEKDGVLIPVRNGVAIDTHPLNHKKNRYKVRALKSLLFPYEAQVAVDMPACTPLAPPDATFGTNEKHGNIELTQGKDKYGDVPVHLPAGETIPVNRGHLDEHLDIFTTGAEDLVHTLIFIRMYTGPIFDRDVSIALDFGDGSPVEHYESADAMVGPDAERKARFNRPSIISDPNPLGKGWCYTIMTHHGYVQEGSYLIRAKVSSRSQPGDDYQLVKTLRRRVRLGMVASVETTESFQLPHE